jgi:hypothetical protein
MTTGHLTRPATFEQASSVIRSGPCYELLGIGLMMSLRAVKIEDDPPGARSHSQ